MFIVDSLANLGLLDSLLVLSRRVHSQTCNYLIHKRLVQWQLQLG